MISVTELRQGTYYTDGENLFQTISYEHIKLGRGPATIKVKVRNVKNGAVMEKSFTSGARVEPVYPDKKIVQYIYKDDAGYCFMDPHSYEQFSVPDKILGKTGLYLTEGAEADVLFWNREPLSVEIPLKMTFTVVETPPGVRGNTVSNLFKEAKLESGAVVKVPLFIKTGDRVVIDTRTGEYVERAGK